jgi:Cd2+/Zn2+-exporting ATPase
MILRECSDPISIVQRWPSAGIVDLLPPLTLRIEGMDCASCAAKIETAVKRLPGVSEVEVNYGRRAMSLALDEDRTPRAAVQAKISALGYTAIDPDAAPVPAIHGTADDSDRA